MDLLLVLACAGLGLGTSATWPAASATPMPDLDQGAGKTDEEITQGSPGFRVGRSGAGDLSRSTGAHLTKPSDVSIERRDAS